MRYLILAIALFFASCGASISPAEYNAAFDLCKPHGGLRYVKQEESFATRTRIRVDCADNELVAYRVVPRSDVQPTTPAASQ